MIASGIRSVYRNVIRPVAIGIRTTKIMKTVSRAVADDRFRELWEGLERKEHRRRIREGMALEEDQKDYPKANTLTRTSEEIEKKIEESKGDIKECVVCLTEKAAGIALPCRHLCVCGACAAKIKDGLCPVCREDCTFHNVYFS